MVALQFVVAALLLRMAMCNRGKLDSAAANLVVHQIGGPVDQNDRVVMGGARYNGHRCEP